MSVEYFGHFTHALIHKSDDRHTNKNNISIANAPSLPKQVVTDPKHNITVHIAISTRDEFSLYP